MAKFKFPDDVFNTEILAGSADKAAKAAGGKAVTEAAGKMLQVPLENLRVLNGFNVRVITDDYNKHVEAIAQSIVANGYYQDKPISGYAGRDGEDHVIYITDGHTRRLAALRAAELGAELVAIPVVIKPQTTTREDMTVALIQANEGRPLSAYEKSVAVKRLIGYGMEKAEIAKRLGQTERNIDNYILLAGAPTVIRDMLIDGKVSGAEAAKALRANPGTASQVLKDAIKIAEAAGKAKATGKHVKAARGEAEGGEGEGEDAGTQVTNTVTAGSAGQKRVYKFKKGETATFESIKEIRLLDGGEWWHRENKTDAEVEITSTIEITVTVKRPAEETVEEIKEPGAEDGAGEQDGGEAETLDTSGL